MSKDVDGTVLQRMPFTKNLASGITLFPEEVGSKRLTDIDLQTEMQERHLFLIFRQNCSNAASSKPGLRENTAIRPPTILFFKNKSKQVFFYHSVGEQIIQQIINLPDMIID